MQTDDRSEGLVQKLVASIQRYLNLQRDFVMLSLTEKLVTLLTALVLGAVLFVIGLIALIFLSLTLVSLLTWLTGIEPLAYAVVTLLFVVLIVLIYRMRGPWIVNPLTDFFANLLLKDDER